MKIGVVDYGAGNIGSVINILEELRVKPILLSRPADISRVNSLILPGVGNFTDCANLLHKNGWSYALRKEVDEGAMPLLGICVGMQLLATTGMESTSGEDNEGTFGLGFIPGRVEHLNVLGCNLRTPHVGWNEVIFQSDQDLSLFKGIPNRTDFYFSHSYAFIPENPAHVIAFTQYGVKVPVVIKKGHIWGSQFHPEKSSRAGFYFLRNFIENRVC
jgi:imidazole glycerol-phosphate synthase subunit HisH